MNFEFVLFYENNDVHKARLGYIDLDLKETLGRTVHYATTSEPVLRYTNSYLYVDSDYNVCSSNLTAAIFNNTYTVIPFPKDFVNYLYDENSVNTLINFITLLNNKQSNLIQDIKIFNNRINSPNYKLFKKLFSKTNKPILAFDNNFSKYLVLITNKFNFKKDSFCSLNGNYISNITPVTNMENIDGYFYLDLK